MCFHFGGPLTPGRFAPLASPAKLYFFPWDLKATTIAKEVIVLVMSMSETQLGRAPSVYY